jgi:hypothetical protein
VTIAEDRTRAHRLIEELCGATDPAADHAVAVLNAHAAALTWIRDTTGSYPAPPTVAAHLKNVAEQLRTGAMAGDPATVLRLAAAEALATYRATAAA